MPIVVVPMKQIKQEQGQQAELLCIVEGHSLGKVSWIFQGKELAESARTAFGVQNSSSNVVVYSLTISSLVSSDFGVYTCQVFNNAGTATGQIELVEKVSGKPFFTIQINMFFVSLSSSTLRIKLNE